MPKVSPKGCGPVNQQKDSYMQGTEEVSKVRKKPWAAQCGGSREGFLEEIIF